MAEKSRKWRLERRRLATGVHWRLRTGRNETRAQVNLGHISAADADRALRRMQSAEDSGGAPRILAWHREDPDQAVGYLIGDAEVDALLEERPDFSVMPLEEYIDQVYAPWRATARPAGWGQEERVWRAIKAELGRVRLRDIDAHVVADYLDGMVARRGPRKGKPASGNTKRLHRAALQALLKRAFRLRHLERLPDLAIFPIEGSSKTVLKQEDPLSLEEVAALLDASGPKHRAMFGVAAGLGLRPSELIRMRWEDVRWETRTLVVRGEKTEESAAEIPTTPIAYRELRAWWGAQEQPRAGLVFPSRGGGMYGPSGYKKALETARKAAGIKRKVTPYLLRHSFATLAWSVGLDMEVTRRIGRWTDDRMLRDVYCRPRPRDLVERAQALALDEER